MNHLKPTFQLIAFLATLTLVLSISPVEGMGQGFDTSGEAESTNENQYIYLPLIMKSPNQIYGYVTDDGAAAPGVELGLLFYDGASWSVTKTTTTDSNGKYQFSNIAALSPGQKYLVSYENFDDDPTNLSYWSTRELDSFTSNSNVNIGDFDIANVALTSPDPGSEAVPPSNFMWAPRPATPSDSYIFNLFDYFDGDPPFKSALLGYVNSYTLSSLPSGFQYCNPYYWWVKVNSPDGGQGASYWVYLVTLHQTALSGIHGCVTVGGVPTSGVPVELWRYNNPGWSSWNTTTTNGYFAFTGIPTLNPGQSYDVEYYNFTDDTRLWYHETQYLDSYTSGSSVHIGDFDIADIPLVSPSSGLTVPPTTTFWWTPRPNTLWDDYEFNLYDPDDGDPWFWTDPSLGYVDHYTLGGLPFPPWSYSYLYWWEIWVYDLYGGFGGSYYSNEVYFSSPGMSATPVEGSSIIARLDRERLLMERARRATQSESQTRFRFRPSLERFKIDH